MVPVRLGGYVELSTVDWRDHLTFMLFLAGCNFACPYCQNSRLIKLDSGNDVGLDSVKALVLKGRRLLDSVGFSGGEPTLQPRAVLEVCRWASLQGLDTFVNTNGSSPSVLRTLLDERLVDHVAVDVKAPLEPEAYGAVIGRPEIGGQMARAVRDTILNCVDSRVSLEVRTTVVPGLMETRDEVERIVSGLPEGDYMYVLQQFVPSPEVLDVRLRECQPTTRGSLLALARSVLGLGLRDVFVRTRELGLERVEAS